MEQITVVMATYNGEKYVKEQIESILTSTYPEYKLEIYDDGSKDSTMEILRDYEERYPELIRVHQNKVNQGVTLNFLNGISNSDSNYIMLCDQDDVWLSDKLSISYHRMKELEASHGVNKPLVVFTDAVVVDEKLMVLQESFFHSGHLKPRKHSLHHLLMENKIIGCTVMINGGVCRYLKAFPLPEKARLHDWWIGLIGESMGEVDYVPKGTLLYRQHGGNVVGNTSFLSYIINRLGSLERQKEILLRTQEQAAEFLQIYGEVLSMESYKVIEEFSVLSKRNWLKRRVNIVRYGFWKTGIIRNIGLMIIV